MASRQGGVDSEPNRIYEVAPKAVAPRAVASNIIFLAAWLAGTAACFLVCTICLSVSVLYAQDRLVEYPCDDPGAVRSVVPLYTGHRSPRSIA